MEEEEEEIDLHFLNDPKNYVFNRYSFLLYYNINMVPPPPPEEADYSEWLFRNMNIASDYRNPDNYFHYRNFLSSKHILSTSEDDEKDDFFRICRFSPLLYNKQDFRLNIININQQRKSSFSINSYLKKYFEKYEQELGEQKEYEVLPDEIAPSSQEAMIDKIELPPEKSREESVSCIGRLFLTHLNPVLDLGRQKAISLADLGVHSKQDDTSYLYSKFRPYWSKYLESGQPSLIMPLFKVYIIDYFLLILLVIITSTISVVYPLLLEQLLAWYETPNNDWRIGLMWGAIMILVSLIGYFVQLFYELYSCRVSFQMLCIISNLVFRKFFRCSYCSRSTITSGYLTNLLVSDPSSPGALLMTSLRLVGIPISFGLGMYFLYSAVTYSALIGFLCASLGTPFGPFFGSRIAKLGFYLAKSGDVLLSNTNSILGYLGPIKMYGWEDFFSDRIISIKKWVTDNGFRGKLFGLFMSSLLQLPDIFTVPVLLSSYVMLGGSLTTPLTFKVLQLSSVLSIPASSIPTLINRIAQTKVGTGRIFDYLTLEEREDWDPLFKSHYKKIHARRSSTYVTDKPFIDMNEYNYDYEDDDQKDDSEYNKGIKSNQVSLELPSSKRQSISYTQHSNASMNLLQRRSVIINEEEYPLYIEDGKFAWLPYTEEVIDNENVFFLSNINIKIPSRAITAIIGGVGSGKSSIIHALLGQMTMLEGNISALPEKFSYCSQSPWLENKSIRDCITFGLNFNEKVYAAVLRHCALETDLAIFPEGDQTFVGEDASKLSGGQKQRIALARAVYANNNIMIFDDPLSACDIKVTNFIFKRCFKMYLREKTILLVIQQLHLLSHCDKIYLIDKGTFIEHGSFRGLMHNGKEFSKFVTAHIDVSKRGSITGGINNKKEEEEEEDVKAVKLVNIDTNKPDFHQESMQFGTVPLSQLFFLLKIFGWGNFFFLGFLGFLFFGISQGTNFFISGWIERYFPRDDYWYIYFYLFISLVTFFFVVTNGFVNIRVWYFFCLKNFSSLIFRLLHSSFRFIDSCQIGILTARIFIDTNFVENFLVSEVLGYQSSILNVATQLFTILTLSYYFGFLVVVVFILIFYYQHIFVAPFLSIVRLALTLNTPIYTFIRNLHSGIDIISAFGVSNIYFLKFAQLLNYRIASKFYESWIINIFISSTTIVVFVFVTEAAGALAAIGLMNSMDIAPLLNGLLIGYINVQRYMTSIERLRMFTNELGQEGPPSLDNDPPVEEWPLRGNIDFQNVTFSYRENLEPAVNDFTINVQHGEKIGICGRTGSGKSSVIKALYRCYPYYGKIIIDDIDIKNVGIHTLRHRISIIPQMPFTFLASLRRNIDPFNLYTDDAILFAIENCIPSFKDFLNVPLPPQISLGQKQLLCLCRVLIQNCNILVLDEATSSVDIDTDELMQNIIRMNFKSSTIISIAHRINTIMHSNRVCVMDTGKVIELDDPRELRNNPASIFASLYKATARKMSSI